MVRKTEAGDEIRSIVGMVGYSRGRGSSPLVPFYSMYIVTHIAVPPLVFPSIFVKRQYRLMAKCRGKSDVPHLHAALIICSEGDPRPATQHGRAWLRHPHSGATSCPSLTELLCEVQCPSLLRIVTPSCKDTDPDRFLSSRLPVLSHNAISHT